MSKLKNVESNRNQSQQILERTRALSKKKKPSRSDIILAISQLMELEIAMDEDSKSKEAARTSYEAHSRSFTAVGTVVALFLSFFATLVSIADSNDNATNLFRIGLFVLVFMTFALGLIVVHEDNTLLKNL